MTTDPEMSWLWHNTDKLILLLLILIGKAMVLYLVTHHMDASVVNWAQNSYDTILGALIMVLTGRITRANVGTNSNGGTPTPTVNTK